jgi:hypothetical protein
MHSVIIYNIYGIKVTQLDSETDKMLVFEEQMQEHFCSTPDKEHSHTARSFIHSLIH